MWMNTEPLWVELNELGAETGAADPNSYRRRQLLTWRLSKSYVLYCLLLLVASTFLLFYNLKRWVQYGHLPEWDRHVWEEWLEIGITVCLTAETATTLYLLGFRKFMRSYWLRFDLAVVVVLWVCVFLVAASKLGWVMTDKNAETKKQEDSMFENLELPFLILRFTVQPLRVVSQITQLVHRTSTSADVPEVDFAALSRSSNTAGGVEVGQQLPMGRRGVDGINTSYERGPYAANYSRPGRE
ncbi:unnamed protein product [Amoebophrya sp. A120]|nr:unnamed protein product [Amoebophrya sp. A120]|eukprot:GSA120T00025215001.1